MSRQAKFVISHLDQQSGPFDESELRTKWVNGDLLPIDYVYDEHKQDWVLVAERFGWTTAKDALLTPAILQDQSQRKSNPPPLPKVSVDSQNAHVQMIDGVGEIDLAALPPGLLELRLRETPTDLNLQVQESLQIELKPDSPTQLTLTLEQSWQTVGHDLSISIKTLNKSGLVCSGHSETYLLQVRGTVNQDIPVTMQSGVASVKLNHTKAELWTLSLHNPTPLSLALPESQTLEWQPGPAEQLIIDGPREHIAGNPLRIQVKALDKYGNVARTFQGNVTLEIKAS